MNTGIDPNLFPLFTWMSPSYPVGSFTFSQGLENAIETEIIKTVNDTTDWLANLLQFGNGYSDLVFLSAAWDCAYETTQVNKLLELAKSYQATSEYFLESSAQGAAFLNITAKTWPCQPLDALQKNDTDSPLYPVVVGLAARGHNIDKSATLSAYGHAWLANLVSAAIRLVPLGQTNGQAIIVALQQTLSDTIVHALETGPEQLSTSTLMADICSMHHETQYTRLFRS